MSLPGSIQTKNQSVWPVRQFLESLNHQDELSKRINLDNYGANFGPHFRVFLGQLIETNHIKNEVKNMP